MIISLSQLLAAPCIIATLLVTSIQASYGLLFLSYLTAETWLGPAAAIIQVRASMVVLFCVLVCGRVCVGGVYVGFLCMGICMFA